MKDRNTGHPRGFGFVTYADSSVVDNVIEDTHIINGKQVEIKRTIPKGAGGSKDIKTKKIFVGGIPTTVSEDEFNEFFAQFGEVKEHQIMLDQSTGRSRGFGFITFGTEEAVDNLLSKGNKLELAGSQVEIKKAEPKKPNPPMPAKRYNDSRPSFDRGFGDPSYGGYGGGGYGGGSLGNGSHRSGGGYGNRASAYGAYGGSEYGGYGGYGGYSGGGPYRGADPSMEYAGRYGGGFSRSYGVGGGYGGPGEGYGGYGGGAGGMGGGYSGSYDTTLGGGYGGASGGASGGSFYGGGGGGSGRGGYNGAGTGRYHPYGRQGH